MARADLPETLAYEIVRLVLGNPERMMQIHTSAAETRLENWDKNGFLPCLRGAVRHLEEKGITVPAHLRD